MLVQYIVPTSSFNYGHTRTCSKTQIGTIDFLSSALVCTSGLVNSEPRKEMARAVPSRVPAFAPLRLLLLRARATDAVFLQPQIYPFRWRVGRHPRLVMSTPVELQHRRLSLDQQ